MSYNYDLNPWDDNYVANTSQPAQQQAAQATGYGSGYPVDGYSNPMNQYNTSASNDAFASGQQYQYQADQQYGAEQPMLSDAGDNQQQQPDQQQQQQPQRSALNRFLRQHVPLCGAIMDTMSGINLPFIDALVQHVNRDLLVSKMFYFFFYSAFGSLFPLMGVYFKQLGMNPAQVGILTGVRPFIEIFSAPFWNSLAERFHKSKALLLFSILSWIVFTYSLGKIRPPASACIAFNDTDYRLYTPYSSDDLSNVDMGLMEENESGSPTTISESKVENEVFMSKMPGSSPEVPKEREMKGEILASEENQNDQRRKRRKKRQTPGPQVDGSRNDPKPADKLRFLYRVDAAGGASSDEGYESQDLGLDVDLENDFDDSLVKRHSEWPRAAGGEQSSSDANGAGWSSFVEPDNEAGERSSSSDDEFDQLYSKGSIRYKRAIKRPPGGANKGGSSQAKESDLFGDGDESEMEPESEESEGKEGEEGAEEERREKSRERENQRSKAAESEEDEQEEGDEEEEKEGNKKNNKSSGPRREKTTSGFKAPMSSAPATTTTTTTTTTTATDKLSQERLPSINAVNKTKRIYRQRHKTPPTHIVGMSPITVEYAVNYNKEKNKHMVTPMFSTIVYKLDDIKEVFFLLLLLISLGEFFSAPALTLADSATLSYLGDNTDLYGRQRMFGSLSWAITLLLVGMALDNATSIADHPCGPHQRERSYTVCFVIFSLLMACAFLTATQFRFNYPKSATGSGPNNATMVLASTTDNSGSTVVTTTVDGGNIDQLYASTQPRSIFNTAPPVNAPPPNSNQQGANQSANGAGKDKFEFLDKWKSAVFAQRTGELPEWINVFRQFRNSLHLMYLFITWFLGCGVGLVFTFLFWHLQDVGGTPTLFGICSVINHISEILAYFFSFSFIKRFGHTRVLSVGLGCNVIRFLYVAFLTNPYYALPFELVQGITHAACFAACCSYISHVSKPELRTSTQGVMQGLHHGIGRACGALLGGYMINAIGSRASFCIYGLLSGCVLAGFLYVRKRVSQLEDEEVKVDDSEALGGYGAPQGVPSAIPGKIAQPVSTQDIDYQW